MSTSGHIAHPSMPLAICPNSFTPARSPASFLSHYPSGLTHNSHPKAFISIKEFSDTGKFSIPLKDPPANLKNKPLIYDFSKFCWLNHINSCPHLPSPDSIRGYQFLPALRLGLLFTLYFPFLLQAHSAVLKLIQLPVYLCLCWLPS